MMFILLAAPAAAFTQETQMLVLGVSPADARVNVTAGSYATVNFLISTNVDLDQNITIGYLDRNWASSEKFITLSNTYNLPVNVSVPHCTPPGEYIIRMIVCRMADERLDEAVAAMSCISPKITVTVLEEGYVDNLLKCTQWKYPLAIVAAAITAFLIVCQVSNIKRKKR